MAKELEVLSGEQAADLAALQAAAAEAEPAIDAQAGPVASQADTWAMLPAMVGSILCMAMPELKPVYSPEACQAWGEAMVPVADEYGWNADDVLGPKMALAVASAPFVLGTVVAIKSRRMLAEPAKGEPANPAPGALVDDPGAGQTSVTFG